MLAGLLFTTHDADDQPGQLTATLPFSGVTLIEYQARLLIRAGAGQLIVLVGRVTPELLGALGRIARRGVTVDTVRSAAEAAETLHPLACVVMLADGLITHQEVINHLAVEGEDALLVVPEEDAPPRLERLGGRAAWAGVARLSARRIGEVAALPRDYDFQSAALRLAEQAGAVHVTLTKGACEGHGIEHSAAALTEHGRGVLAIMLADRRNWFNAWVLAPIARSTVPRLIDRGVSSAVVGVVSILLGIVGLLAILFDAQIAGLFATFGGCLSLGVGRTLSALRDQDPLARIQSIAIDALAGAAALAIGWVLASDVAMLGAVVLVYMGMLGLRASRQSHRRAWWGGPPAYLLILVVGTAAGLPLVGVLVALLYAAATLAVAVETLRTEA